MPAGKKSAIAKDSTAHLGFEAALWLAADKLRNNMDAAEYEHVVLGLIFPKYISGSFEEQHAKPMAREREYAGANPEDRDDYRAGNIIWVPSAARWCLTGAWKTCPTALPALTSPKSANKTSARFASFCLRSS